MIALFENRCTAFAALTLAALLATAGCTDRTVTVEPPPKPEPTPAERFERFVSDLRQRIEDDTIGMATAASDIGAPPAEPVPIGKFRVESELFAPADDSEPYRGTVYLFDQSKVTVTIPAPEQNENDPTAATDEGLDLDVEGLPDLDSLRVPGQPRAATTLRSSPTREIEPGETRTVVEFEFRDGRWTLVTELDPKKPFYSLAIEQALTQQ